MEAGADPTAVDEQIGPDRALNLRTIIVPTDLSPDSFRALEYALPLARRFEAKIHLVYVYDTAALEVAAPAEMNASLREVVELRYSHRLAPDECHIRAGRPFREIIAAAAELHAGLIVTATHGQGGFRHLTLGSTAAKVVRHAPCPVLVVRQGERSFMKENGEGIALQKILVPVDFSDCARAGARYASAFATHVGADLQLMHVVQPPDYLAPDGGIPPGELTHLIEAARLRAEDGMEKLVNFLPLVNITAETEVAVGLPADCLAERTRADDIDMVITSTHGGGGLRQLLLGSVAEQLVRTASCPVLVVPSFFRDPGDPAPND